MSKEGKNTIRGEVGGGHPLIAPAKNFIQKAVRPVGLAALLVTLFVFRSTPMIGPPAYLVPAAIGTLMLALLRREVWGSSKEGWVSAFVIAASIRVVAEVAAIVVFGAGINAVTLDPLSALVGFLAYVPLALGIEAGRVYIIKRGGNNAATVIGIALLMTLALIPYPRLAQLAGPSTVAWAYLTRSLLPSFANNLVLSELAAWWGFRASATYSLLAAGMSTLSPIIPNTPWFAVAVFSVTVAVIQVFSIVPEGRRREVEERRRGRRGGIVDKLLTAGVLALLAVAVAGFAMGYRAMVVVSGSMEPGIQRGDIVVSAPSVEAGVGDIIAYASPQGIVVHRVIDESLEDGEVVYKTKGDANNAPDPWVVPKESVIGRVVAVIPYLGYPMYYLSSVLGGFAQATTAMMVTFFLAFYVHQRFIGGDLV